MAESKIPRQCGSCTLCCKVMGIKALGKPGGAWCSHCKPGQGCEIYAQRPDECRDFVCDWLAYEYLSPDWKPEKSKIVMRTEGSRLVAYVDPATPGAWKKAPYLEGLTKLMQALLPRNVLVFVALAERYTLLLPGRHQELGLLGPGDEVVLKTVRTATGIDYQVEVRRAG